jgi:putative DNA primase/helicase
MDKGGGLMPESLGLITGWDPGNPPEVERAFRAGFLIGAERCAHIDLDDAAAFEKRLHTRRGDIYHGELNMGFDRWSDRRAALLRGAHQGGVEAVRARAAGVNQGLVAWLDALREWAAEEPIRLECKYAMPPEWPKPDSPPLGRDGVPKALWGQVFGCMTMVDSLSAPVALIRQRGPFIESKEQYERLRATELAKLRERIRAHEGEFAGLEKLSQYEPDVQAVWHQELAARAARIPGPVLVRVADVQPDLVRWLWPGRIALGKLTLLCGDPGLGKSFITLDLAARTSAGSTWPDIPLLKNPPGGVVLLSAEDDLADTIRPRLDAADADPTRIAALQAVRRLRFDGKTEEAYFDLTQDLPALEAAIQKTADCRLVIIDPLTAYLGKIDGHKNTEVRAILARLFELAAKHKVAILAVTHLNKASTLPAIYRAMGSLAFVAAARAVWAVVRDEDDETGRRRLFVPVKNNLGADETGLAYALEPVGQTARVKWESGAVNMRADDALSGGRKAVVRDDATEFVIATLRANGGDMLSDDLCAAAKAEGISKMTLRRAKEAVAEAYKEKGRDGRWRCKLKGAQQDDPDTHTEQIRTS